MAVRLRIALEYLRQIVAAVRDALARARTAVRTRFSDRLDRWRVGNSGRSVELARQLRDLGADLIDCSSGGNVAHARIPAGPGYQARVCRADPPGSQHLDWGGWDDHISHSGRAHYRYTSGGRGHHRPRTLARSILAPCGQLVS